MGSPGSFPGTLHCFRQFTGTPGEANESAPGRPTVLGKVAETELAAHIRSLVPAGIPLTRVQVRGIAYEYAIANEIGGFSGKGSNKCAGYYWLEDFMKRNSELSVKKADNLSAAGAMAMN